jgi:hypothetical protein
MPGCLAKMAEHRRAPRAVDVPYPIAADPVSDDRDPLQYETQVADAELANEILGPGDRAAR